MHLSRTVNNGVDVRITTLADLAGLMAGFAGRGRLILQGDNFPDEDIGFVRRFLANNPHWNLVLVGKDAGTRPARVILGMDRTRWLAVPPDLDQMRELVRYPSVPEPPSWERKEEESELAPPPPPAPVQVPPPQPTTPPGSPPAGGVTPTAPVPVEATPPRQPPTAAHRAEPLPSPKKTPPVNPPSASSHPETPRSASARSRKDAAVEVRALEDPVAELSAQLDVGATATVLDSGEMRAQVAALADIAQRLELSLESGDGPPPGLGAPNAELARLRRFTHMLAHVTSPPPRGLESFDLGDLLEEKLASVALATPKELRFLPKGKPGLRTLADRDSVGTALEAVIDLARACAEPNGVVKAPYSVNSAGLCEVVLDFPAGPLSDADPARALRPGGVQEELPDLGPADLPAAAALIAAQGGTLSIEAGGDLRLRVVIEMPCDDA